ncbi:hypothetical protein C0J52_08481 [Blattella germanica]|nr:hypothetical protein C0J52_08481 [Blattella germanica]
MLLLIPLFCLQILPLLLQPFLYLQLVLVFLVLLLLVIYFTLVLLIYTKMSNISISHTERLISGKGQIQLPGSHFRTLNDKEVKICNRLITVEKNDIARPYSTHILFEETFYTADLSKYKVLCIENPLERHRDVGLGTQSDDTRVITVQTLRDCIDFLWTESTGKEILEKIDEVIVNFLKVKGDLEFESLQSLRDNVGTLYTLCLQIALKDTRLKEKSDIDKHLLENVKVSVETYMHHAIYRKLIKGITACTAYEDSFLNKVVRNLSDVQLRDLEVRSDLYDSIPRAKRELARIEGYSTVLGKIGCLRRMITAISKPNMSGSLTETLGNAIATDDLLSVIVFLIIKTSLPNLIAHLTFMKQFRFSSCTTCQVDECSFVITTLEAAIEHIKSGILYGPSAPEAQHVYEEDLEDGHNSLVSEKIKPIRISSCGDDSCIAYFFEQVRLGDVEKVKDIIMKKSVSASHSESKADFLPHLCHPLCSCDRCEGLLSKSLCDTTPTVHSCDDRGFTALHVACLFGHLLVVELLINSGANVNISDYSGSTPLHYAAAKGHQNALLLLLHSGSTINVCDNDGNTPLHLASNNGHEECVKALLYFAEYNGSRLNPNCGNGNGDTPLHHAARWGYENIVQILLEYGASPNVENKRKYTPLNYAHSVRVTKLLANDAKHVAESSFETKRDKINCGEVNADIATVSKLALDFSDDSVKSNEIVIKPGKSVHGIRPRSTEQIKKVERLLRAIAFGDLRLSCYYLGLDGPLSTPNNNEVQTKTDIKSLCHPLCLCEKCQPDDSSDMSLENDARLDKEALNINVCNSDGFTPLHVSAMHGRTDIVRLLLDAGAHVNVVTRTKGVTPLHLACQNQNILVVKLLLQSGDCNVDIQDASGNTALHYASFTSNYRLVELILKYGPIIDLKNSNGKTPLNEAEEKLALSVVRLLKGGKTALQLPWEEGKDIIFGPMFSGKTTELIRRLKRYQIAKYKCLIVKYANDDRYNATDIVSHDRQTLAAVSARKIEELRTKALTYDVIGIDEGQFVKCCEEMANLGKIVIIAALDGTFQRVGFGSILNLVPLSENVVKLSAVCMICYGDAAYTKRIGSETELEVIGGADKYMAVCRSCHGVKVTPRSPLKRIQNQAANEDINYKKSPRKLFVE